MENKNLYVAISIILIVLAFFLISGSITGKLGSVYEDCIDSDDGDVPMVGGIVSYSSYDKETKYKDYCFSRTGFGPEKWLNEYYCLPEDNVQSRDYNCDSIAATCVEDENGVGRCINLTGDSICIDSDVGLDYRVRGSVCVNDECKEDFCIDEIYLSEAYCKDKEIGLKIYECRNKCENGKCVDVAISGEVMEEGAPSIEVLEEEIEVAKEKESFGFILKKLFCKITHLRTYQAYEECVY